MTSVATSRLADEIRLVPGYDPCATAGDCTFDEAAAQHAIGFFHDCLTHVKGEWAGEPFELEPWQRAIIGNIFGWKRPDGTRRYREAFIFVPRKNGKSMMAAGICNYMLFCDGEPGAEIYCAAAERDQAALVFDVAKHMVVAEPALYQSCRVFTKAITIEHIASSFKAISADASTKHGYNTHCAVIDELHAQRTRDLVDVLVSSTGARRQPLVVHITTSDYDREGSICNEKHDYASRVRDGIIDDPSFLPVIYEASRDDDWADPAVWRKANPNLNVSVSEDYLAHECLRAQESPTYENTFKRLHLNLRTEQDMRWLPMSKWDACGGEPVDEDSLVGKECWAGLDLASTTDIAAFVMVFPDAGNAVVPYFWCPRDNTRDRERRDRVPYTTWARDGDIALTDGNVIDYDVIRRSINELGKAYNIRKIAIDRWNSTQLQTQLMGDGFEIVQFGQGYASMSAPTKELEKLVLSGEVAHGGHPVLRWMASNVAVEMDAAGNLKPSKKKSSEKIDGIAALIMALGLIMVREPAFRSVYEDRGVLFF